MDWKGRHIIFLIYRWHVYVENPQESTEKATGTNKFNKGMEYKVKKQKFYLYILAMNNWKLKNSIHVKIWNRDKIYQDMYSSCTRKINIAKGNWRRSKYMERSTVLWIEGHGIIKMSTLLKLIYRFKEME